MKKLIGLIAITTIFLTSCEMWHTDIVAFLDKYTNTAAIEKEELINGGNYPSINGVKHIPSDGDKILHFILRNPQNYSLSANIEWDDLATLPSRLEDGDSNPDYSLTQLSDKSIIALTFFEDYLKELDVAGGADVSAIIKITEKETLRDFGSYSFNLVANSAPPVVTNAQFGKAGEGNDQTWWICFNAPEKEGLHPDIDTIVIDGITYDYDDSRFEEEPSGIVNKLGVAVVLEEGEKRYLNTAIPASVDVNRDITVLDQRGLKSPIVTINTGDIPTAAKPIISTDGDISEAGNKTVSLSTQTDGATIYYTINGGEPTIGSMSYTATGPFAVSIINGEQTVQAIAVRGDMQVSAIASHTFLQLVARPTITVGEANGEGYKTVTIETATDGTTIYYTDDGTTPSIGSTLYQGTFPVNVKSAGKTIRAIAVKDGWTNSLVKDSNITKAEAVGTPLFGSPYDVPSGSELTITGDSNTTIYYTTGNSEFDSDNPTANNWTKYISSSKPQITFTGNNTSITFRAIATATNKANSSVATKTYTKEILDPPTVQYNGSTLVSGANVTYTSSATFRLSATIGAIEYKFSDQSSFESASSGDSVAIRPGATSITVRATKDGYQDSDNSEIRFVLKASQVYVSGNGTGHGFTEDEPIGSYNAAVNKLLTTGSRTMWVLGEPLDGNNGNWNGNDTLTIKRYKGYTGALIAVTNGTLTLQNITVDGNKSVQQASAPLIHVSSGGILSLTDTRLENNHNGSGNGGAILASNASDYTKNNRSITLNDGVIIRNNEAVSGGGIFGGVISVQGNVQVHSNTGNNIAYDNVDRPIKIIGSLSGSDISITASNIQEGNEVAIGHNGHSLTLADRDAFSSDTSWRIFQLTTDNRIVENIRLYVDNASDLQTALSTAANSTTPHTVDLAYDKNAYNLQITNAQSTVTIEGLRISSSPYEINGGGAGRVLTITNSDVVLGKNIVITGGKVKGGDGNSHGYSGSTIRGGDATVAEGGGVLLNGGSLTLTENASITSNTVIGGTGGGGSSGNTVSNATVFNKNTGWDGGSGGVGGEARGAGVFVVIGTLRVKDSASIIGNIATGGSGGAGGKGSDNDKYNPWANVGGSGGSGGNACGAGVYVAAGDLFIDAGANMSDNIVTGGPGGLGGAGGSKTGGSDADGSGNSGGAGGQGGASYGGAVYFKGSTFNITEAAIQENEAVGGTGGSGGRGGNKSGSNVSERGSGGDGGAGGESKGGGIYVSSGSFITNSVVITSNVSRGGKGGDKGSHGTGNIGGDNGTPGSGGKAAGGGIFPDASGFDDSSNTQTNGADGS